MCVYPYTNNCKYSCVYWIVNLNVSWVSRIYILSTFILKSAPTTPGTKYNFVSSKSK